MKFKGKRTMTEGESMTLPDGRMIWRHDPRMFAVKIQLWEMLDSSGRTICRADTLRELVQQ